MEASIAIIIVNWNSYDDTSKCLISLRDIEYTNYEIVVVDNGSEDGSGDQLKIDFPEITLLKNAENLGFTGGNNTGLRYALEKGFDLLMLLNNDTIITPSFAKILSKSLESDSIGAVQPKILYNQEREVIWNAGSWYSGVFNFPMTIGYNKKDKGQFDQEKDIPWITGCCFLVKSSIIKEIGLLDDRFFIYYEDADWSLRIRKLGFSLKYLPQAKIYHEVGRSHNKRSSQGEGNLSPFAHYLTVRNGIFLMRKHASGVYLLTSWIYQLFKLFAYSAYFLFKRRFKKLRATWNGFGSGVGQSLS